MSDELIIGMLSGTSRDGVDAVLVNFNRGSMDLLHAACTPYPAAIRTTLEQLLETGAAPDSRAAGLLDDTLGRFFARVAQNLARDAGMEMRDIALIGSHGQNVWHRPGGEDPMTMQLGNGRLIARNTGVTVVADFRSADVKAGGQGAPLAPLLHRQLFRDDAEDRAVLNLGGIANLTLLPSKGGVRGFDCGPGNCLMDAWCKRHLGRDFDENGAWAAAGKLDRTLLGRLLEDPYFAQEPPKSTGLEYFNLSWLGEMTRGLDLPEADTQATLAELTALAVSGALNRTGMPRRLITCGGGVHNGFLMRRIAAALPDVAVEPSDRHGVHPDWVEGLLFAWLARERRRGNAQDTPPVTGARHPVLLGEIFEP